MKKGNLQAQSRACILCGCVHAVPFNADATVAPEGWLSFEDGLVCTECGEKLYQAKRQALADVDATEEEYAEHGVKP